MTGVAVVGIGNWGQNLVRTFDAVASVPVCCHTGDGENAAWLAEHYPEIDLRTDYDAVLADDRVDAVAVATPIPTLADRVERALQADTHVYVEKPMAQTRERAGELVALADKRGLTLFVGYVFVHHPVYSQLQERIAAEGADHLWLEWTSEGSFGTDIVNNIVCHPVSLAVATLGEPDSVSVTGTRAFTGGTDVVKCTLRYADLDCALRVDRLSPRKARTVTAFTGAGNAYAATDDALYGFDRQAKRYDALDTPDVEPLARECRAFVDAVEGDTTPFTGGSFGVAVHSVLEEIKQQR